MMCGTRKVMKKTQQNWRLPADREGFGWLHVTKADSSGE